MKTDSHADMLAGELETSYLLQVAPKLVRPVNHEADWTADHRPHMLTLGTQTGVIGSPSLGTADKGRACLDSLTQSFADYLQLLMEPGR